MHINFRAHWTRRIFFFSLNFPALSFRSQQFFFRCSCSLFCIHEQTGVWNSQIWLNWICIILMQFNSIAFLEFHFYLSIVLFVCDFWRISDGFVFCFGNSIMCYGRFFGETWSLCEMFVEHYVYYPSNGQTAQYILFVEIDLTSLFFFFIPSFLMAWYNRFWKIDTDRAGVARKKCKLS